MENLSAFLTMGGYAGYIWPAYGLAVVVMAGVLVASVRLAHKNEKDLSALQSLRSARRRARASANEVSQA